MKKHISITALLTAATGIFVAISIAIFSQFAVAALHRSQDSANALAVASLKRNMFSTWDCIRSELGQARAAYSGSEVMSNRQLNRLRALHNRCDSKVVSLVAALRANPSITSTVNSGTLETRRDVYQQQARKILRAIGSMRASYDKQTELRWAASLDDLSREIEHLSKTLSARITGNDAETTELLRINDAAWRVRADAGVHRRHLGDALRSRNPEIKIRLLDHLQGRIQADWSAIDEGVNLAQLPAQMAGAITAADREYFERYLRWRDDIVSRLARGEVITMSRQELLNTSNRGINSLAAVSSTALDLTEKRAKAAATTARDMLVFAGTALLLSVVISCLAGAYFMRRVVSPLKLLTKAMKESDQGRLDQDIPFEARNDEIGQFAKTLRVARDSEKARQRLEIEMVRSEAARDVAETSNRTKSEFLANMSHELRTPLNAILGFSEIISSETFGPGVPRYRAYAEDIHGAGAHLLSLINDILDISKAEAGKMEISPEEVDLMDLIRESVRLMERRADQKKVRVAIVEHPLPALHVDRLRTKQVLLNVLSNAIKFTDEAGQVSIEPMIDGRGNIVVSVKDTGIGIAPEMISLAFEPFRQVDASLSRKFEGTGLGLPLVKSLMELHGGTVELESALGQGTTVRLTFPAGSVSAWKVSWSALKKVVRT